MRILLSTLLVGVALTLGGCFEGPKGDKGDAGVAGVAGPAGKDGTSGKDGAAGKDGAPGKDGAAGKDGASGKDGVAGKDGATIRTVRHACSGGNCSHSCDKGELVVNALCVGSGGAAQFKSDADNLVATCGGTEAVTMQLYCLKP